jgi:hypothetical protein
MSSFETGVIFEFYNDATSPTREFVIKEVRITEFSMNTVANKENPRHQGLECRVAGEALWHGGNEEESAATVLVGRIRNYTTKPQPNVKLYIKMDRTSAVADSPRNWVIYDFQSENRDLQFGPYLKIDATQIVGTNAVVIRFTMEWTQSRFTTEPILNFYVRSTFSVDETGATTIRKSGSLEVSQAAFQYGQYPALPDGRIDYPTDNAGSPNSVKRLSPPNPLLPSPAGDAWRNDIVLDKVPEFNEPYSHPDYFRMWVAGNLYPGFRRISQEYAVDESGRRLIFDVMDKEFHRGLPAPARVGNCQFTFERSIDDQNQALGIKHFIASVKGDRNVTAGALLALCIRLSQNRIDYANDLVVKARVTEENMLTENAITFEVAAKATSLQTFTPGATSGSTTGGSSSLVPQGGYLLRNILSPITIPSSGGGVQRFDFVPAQMPFEYGTSGIIRYVTDPYGRDDIPRDPASTQVIGREYQLEDGSYYGTTYFFPNSVFDILDENQDESQLDPRFRYRRIDKLGVPIGPNAGDVAAASDSNKTETEKNADSNDIANAFDSKQYSNYSVRTGIVDCPPVSGNAPTKVFQLCAPRVMKNDVVQAAAKNRAPKRPFDELPSSQPALVGSFDINVSSGTPDINGNRVLTSVMTRDSRLLPPSDLPSAAGPSPTNPDWRVVSQGTGESAFLVVQYNPQTVRMPDSETQGVNTVDSRPSYTASVSDPIRYLT